MKAKSSKSAAKARAVDAIGDFYTNHPYPPPLENLDRARDMWRDENVHRAEYHLFWPHKEYRADFEVLVAGCGTWQAAKFAICHPAARVVAIDISPTSLEHTERLKQKYDLDNLETRQLPIEKATELDQAFDLIVSTGVLHHLVDPDAGLRALSSVLRPDGAMYLMVYGPYGRTGVSMFQEYCRKLGVGISQQEVNDLTAVLQTLPQHHPLLSMLRGSRDSLRADALVDAVLNPRDRTYSVAQLFDFLEGAGLGLKRWYWQAAYLPQCGFVSETPHAGRLGALPEREQYVAMELLRGLITNHDFVAHRSNENNDAAKVHFDDEDYLRYVPIRRPWTMCVQERLPPGAAGVLLNQTHLFDDLFFLINAREKEFYDAIDGRRSISEIVERVNAQDSQHAREFFEKLWRYDQVVFDTSQSEAD
ncbi:MAG TPA: class I SAM-dependent methyltransferase [Pyrinomonadaceae bacterium]|nr:class I SAM-dependent methyltransferase [Pyrinomonadaceae bacterium]